MRIANSLGLRRGHRCSVRVAFVSAGASLAATLVLVLVTLVIASFAVPGVAAAAASVTDPGTVHTYAYDIPPHLAGPTDTTVERGPPATYNDATMYDADGLLSLGAPARSNAAAIRGDFDYDDLAPVVQLASRSRGAEGRVGSVEADLAAVERSGVAANWVDEGGDLRSGRPSMPQGAYDYQSGTLGARSNPLTGRSMAPQLEMPGVDGSTVAARFDGINGSEAIDRKLNPVFSAKAVWQARRQAGVAAYNGFQAVWELSTPQSVSAANRFMDYAGISTLIVRQAN